MKKISMILLIGSTLFSIAPVQKAEAQAGSVVSLVSQYGNTVDTVTNSGTKYLTIPKKIQGYQKLVTIAVNLAEISGTTGGTITVEASLDSSSWYSFYAGRDSATAITAAHTFTPLDQATNVFRFSLFDVRELWLRIKYGGTGTMSDKVYAKLLY
jgi:hypothetical protein